MFSLLRVVIVVGVIFYLSPVRQGGDPIAYVSSLLGWGEEAPARQAGTPTAESSPKLETLWKALPDTAKQAIVDEILNRSGIGSTAARPAASTDTLHANDKKPAWRGDPPKPAP
jgi:hypothetical protein